MLLGGLVRCIRSKRCCYCQVISTTALHLQENPCESFRIALQLPLCNQLEAHSEHVRAFNYVSVCNDCYHFAITSREVCVGAWVQINFEYVGHVLQTVVVQ